MLIFLTLYSSKILNTVSQVTKTIKHHNCFPINHHIRMISEGSWDTEDWRNDAENSALHHRNKLHFTVYSHTEELF